MALHLSPSDFIKFCKQNRGLKLQPYQKAIAKVLEAVPNLIDTWRRLRFPMMKLGPEDAITVDIMNWLRSNLPEGWCAFHVPSEAKRSKVWWGKLLAMGYFNGLPDIFIVMPAGRVAFIEVKRDHRESSLTDAQKAFRSWCCRGETPHLVAIGIPDVEPFLKALKAASTGLSPE